MVLPKLIIVVGPSGGGKSTFVMNLRKYYKEYRVIDDLFLLQEIFRIDDCIQDIVTVPNSKNKSQGIAKFKKVGQNIQYCHEIWDNYHKIIMKGQYDKLKPRYSIACDNGGHKIIDPNLWDQVLKLLVRELDMQEHYILQFSRGTDQAYLKAKFITPNEVYLHAIQMIISNLPTTLKNSILIIHITASYRIRIERNKKRYLEGGHFVSDLTMQQVYAKDIFEFINDDEAKASNKGYISVENSYIPVYSITNEEEMLPDNLSEYFSIKLKEALKFYTLCQESDFVD